jgi:hypothetical protein
MSIKTGAIIGTETAYPSEPHELTVGFSGFFATGYLVLCAVFYRSLFVLL